MRVDTLEKLTEMLDKCNIQYERIKIDEVGFSRTFKCKSYESEFIIEWYKNYSTLMIGDIHIWFNDISSYSGYPMHGTWVEFGGMDSKIHIRVRKE